MAWCALWQLNYADLALKHSIYLLNNQTALRWPLPGVRPAVVGAIPTIRDCPSIRQKGRHAGLPLQFTVCPVRWQTLGARSTSSAHEAEGFTSGVLSC